MPSLSERLEESFGPFNVVSFLSPRKGSKSTPHLKSVLFRQGHEVVGLDILDNIRLRDRGPLLFMGTLKLTAENKSWLSEEGKRGLQQNIAERLGNMERQYFNSRNLKVKVRVCGELFGDPLYLDKSSTFTIVSRDSSTGDEHQFIVRSLHVQSYALSRVYLSKWSMLKEIMTIVDQNEQTPLMTRTPRWLVTKYLEANMEHFHSINGNPTLTPRRVHRSEVFNMLARHCRWLQSKLSKSRKQLLNKNAWKVFVQEVEDRWKKVPRKAGDSNSEDCDRLEKLWLEEDELLPSDAEEDIPNVGTAQEPEPQPLANRSYQHTYTQVVGRQKSREISYEQIDHEEQKPEVLTDPAVFAAVPKCLIFREPSFPMSSEWRCPVDTCDYAVVLREAVNMAWMDQSDRAFLRSQDWDPKSDRAVELFHDIVEYHFYEHLDNSGIKHIACKRMTDATGPKFEFVELKTPRESQSHQDYIGFKFEWTKPDNHRPAFRFM